MVAIKLQQYNSLRVPLAGILHTNAGYVWVLRMNNRNRTNLLVITRALGINW